MIDGWIKLHRALLDNPIWTSSTPEQKVILITLLTMVNHTPNKWLWKGKKYEVKPGQMITSLDSIVKECGKNVSIRNVRTALVKFKKLEFLTDEVTSQGRFISVINWDTYQMTRQATDKVSDKQVTDDRQAPDKHLTPNKERKNVKKEKKEITKDLTTTVEGVYDPKNFKGKHLMPDNWKILANHYQKATTAGFSNDFVNNEAQTMYDWSHGKGEKRMNWNLVFNNWIDRAIKQGKSFNKPRPIDATKAAVSNFLNQPDG